MGGSGRRAREASAPRSLSVTLRAALRAALRASLRASLRATLCASLAAARFAAAQEPPAPWVELTEEDLAPIPLGPSEARVRAHIRAEEWAAAAALVTAPYEDPSVQYLRAWLYSQAGDWHKVRATLSDLPLTPALRDAALTLRAEAAVELLDYAGAEDAASRVSRGDRRLYYEALRYRARALRELKRWGESERVSLELLQSDDDGDRAVARLGLALTARDQGRAEDALRALKAVDVHHPGSGSAARAQRELRELLGDSSQLRAAWAERSAAERAIRAAALFELGRAQEAVEDIEPLLRAEVPDDLRCHLMILKGRAHDRLKQRAAALEALREALSLCEKLRHEETPLALFVASRVAERMGLAEEHEALSRRLFEGYRHRLSDDAAVSLIRLYTAAGLEAPPGAPAPPGRADGGPGGWLDKVMAVARAVPALHPSGDMSPEALSFALVATLRAQRLDLAREVVALSGGLLPSDFSYYDSGRFQYWRAPLGDGGGQGGGGAARGGGAALRGGHPLGAAQLVRAALV